MLFEKLANSTRPHQSRGTELPPGVTLLAAFLDAELQEELYRRIDTLGSGAGGWYRPKLRTGTSMRLRMMCLGMHWSPVEYRYRSRRTDHDGAEPPTLPADLAGLARQAARAAHADLEPDVCICNAYGPTDRLGLHQDRDEDPATLRAGIPIVSFSLGCDADFVIGGTTRRAPTQTVTLRSGDALVMGGPGRLLFHGIERIRTGTGPPRIALAGGPDRINLTLRAGARPAA